MIDEDVFARVNEASRRRVMAQQRPGRSLVNMFGGIARCSCGSIMTFRGKGLAKRAGGKTVREDYLVCDAAIRKRGCENRTHYNYAAIEAGVLDKLIHLALDPSYFRKADVSQTLEAELATLKRHLVEDEKRQAKAYALAIEDDEDDAAAAGYRTIKAKVKAAKATILRLEAELADASAMVSPEQHIKRVDEVRALMSSDDPDERYQARAKVKMALNSLIEKMTFGIKGLATVVLVDRVALFTINRSGVIEDDFDFMSMFPGEAGPGYGRVTITENGKTTYRNDLTDDQKGASEAYVRREEQAEDA